MTNHWHSSTHYGRGGLCAAALLAGMAIATTATAGTQIHPLEEIRAVAEQRVEADLSPRSGQRTEIRAGHLDSRLRLRRCDQPLEARHLQNSRRAGNATISVRCPGTKPWTVHVPVTVKAYTKVVVADRPLARQLEVRAEDVRLEEREITSLRTGYFQRIEDVVGRQPKRTLMAGAPLSPYDLESNKIIRRGHKVVIIAETAGIAVRMQGKALKDAGKGELVPVENLSSKRKIEAVAERPGVVKVPM